MGGKKNQKHAFKLVWPVYSIGNYLMESLLLCPVRAFQEVDVCALFYYNTMNNLPYMV